MHAVVSTCPGVVSSLTLVVHTRKQEAKTNVRQICHFTEQKILIMGTFKSCCLAQWLHLGPPVQGQS